LFQLAGQLHFFSITALSSGSTGFHSWTSSKISSAGPHTERRWRCSKCFVLCLMKSLQQQA
jgi:hypothetical protein